MLQVLRSRSMSSTGLQRVAIAQITWSMSVGSTSSSTAMIHFVKYAPPGHLRGERQHLRRMARDSAVRG